MNKEQSLEENIRHGTKKQPLALLNGDGGENRRPGGLSQGCERGDPVGAVRPVRGEPV